MAVAIGLKDMFCMLPAYQQFKGTWYGNPLDFIMPRLMMQAALSTTFVATAEHFLTPLGQSSNTSCLIGAILLGPAVMGRTNFIRDLFQSKRMYTLETFQYFGCMFFLFILGLKMDLSMIKKSGQKALGIGFSCFFVPLFLSVPFSFMLKRYVKMDPKLYESISAIAVLESLSSFHVVSHLLLDLELLNSELGRIAMSSSMISGLCSWGTVVVLITTKPYFSGDGDNTLFTILCLLSLLFIIFFVMRPIIFWIIRANPEGKTIKEFHLIIVFIMVLSSAFMGEIVGQHFLLGPVILGLAFPVSSSIGAQIEDKLHSFVTSVLLPLFYVSSSGLMKVELIQTRTFIIVQLVVLFAFMGKLLGTVLASMYCRMPLSDALLVGLILSSQGFVEIQLFRRALFSGVITAEAYTIMLILIMLITGSISPLVKAFYNPTKRYIGYKRRTILHSRHQMELRIVACIYRDDDVPNIINILEASNPSKENPLCIYPIHLIELQGRSNPTFTAHNFRQTSFRETRPHRSQHIINAFKFFEQHNLGLVSVNPFTSISPYVTMHDDVCTLALEKKTSLIIVPFHRQRNEDGVVEFANKFRCVNKNILRMAPCSVGILIDAQGCSTCFLWSSKSSYRVGVIFLGGADDREALAYGMRMTEQCNVSLTLFRFYAIEDKSIRLTDKKLDGELLDEFRILCNRNKRVEYREFLVADGIGTVSGIQSMDNCFELVMAGRHHDSESPLLSGLAQWSQFPELGVIGDMLATKESDNKMSTMVVQQQFRATEFRERNSLNHCITI